MLVFGTADEVDILKYELTADSETWKSRLQRQYSHSSTAVVIQSYGLVGGVEFV